MKVSFERSFVPGLPAVVLVNLDEFTQQGEAAFPHGRAEKIDDPRE